MSITTCTRVKNVGGLANYIFGKDGSRPAEQMLLTPGGVDSWQDWVKNLKQMRSSRDHQSTVDAIGIVQSFPAEELDKDNPNDVRRGLLAASALAQTVAPNAPAMIGMHTDSKSGCVHAHIIIGNWDVSKQSALDVSEASNWHRVKTLNDQVMQEHGLEICVRDEVSYTKSERLSQREGREFLSTREDGTLTEVTKDTWTDHTRRRIELLVSDPRVKSFDDVKKLASEHGLGIDTQQRKRGETVRWTLLDDKGDPYRFTWGGLRIRSSWFKR